MTLTQTGAIIPLMDAPSYIAGLATLPLIAVGLWLAKVIHFDKVEVYDFTVVNRDGQEVAKVTAVDEREALSILDKEGIDTTGCRVLR